MVFKRAIVRMPGENFAMGLTTQLSGKPDLRLTLQQHKAYRQALLECGLELTILEADLDFPDSTFVEDTAVVTSICAIVTRPGARSRTGEIKSIQLELGNFFDHIESIQAPGCLDGGDICQVNGHFFIGLSGRTNEPGARQLAGILDHYGFSSEIVDIRKLKGILHLKSGLSYVGEGNLVLTDQLFHHPAFKPYHKIKVLPGEAYAANCVRVNNSILFAEGYPVLAESLRARSYSLIELPVSEFRKMDGGLSCLSLRF